MSFSFRAVAPVLALALLGVVPAPRVAAQPDILEPGTLAGAYLTGAVAFSDDNFAQLAQSYDLALASDPDNAMFRELALQGHLASGNFARAVELATEAEEAGDLSSTGAAVLQAAEFLRGDYEAVISAAEAGRQAGPLNDSVGVAWAELGLGSMSDALAAFDATIEQHPQIAAFALYHKALALALVGDMEGANALFADEEAMVAVMPRRGIVARLSVLSQLGQFDEARALAEDAFGSSPPDEVAGLVADLAAETPVPFTTIASARDGMAEVYFTLALALVGGRDAWAPLIHARLALALRPDLADAILLAGNLLERAGQYALADQIYATMPADSPEYLSAELGRANALFQSGQEEAAVDSLFALSTARADSVQVFSALGDMLRRKERFDEAAEAYASAIDLIDEIEERHWVLLYTQAIALERMGEWERAEPVFRRVLEFVPDEPQVLNYLGYSLIEQRRNLDEALDMIERAVEGEPDSGYITDSLGWAYYRLGRYDEAVPVMERAVELLPRDPVLNDHLGDVYYAVGRTREARFQWRRALSFGPHPDLDMDMVRRKLEIGKDAALKEAESSQ
ncbi:tetratricopeptide repeat protein [Natronohydrobacter thiooxidans]|uniref:tetratricopeptide repeat protein n=1 Tax=Natronohydrobacter thiooxidans TaxID=87172 RepID=UPI0008FF4E92|nr:tetratricopeptide repeat protein [Natronohydrobacter thiooxidans]